MADGMFPCLTDRLRACGSDSNLQAFVYFRMVEATCSATFSVLTLLGSVVCFLAEVDDQLVVPLYIALFVEKALRSCHLQTVCHKYLIFLSDASGFCATCSEKAWVYGITRWPSMNYRILDILAAYKFSGSTTKQ